MRKDNTRNHCASALNSSSRSRKSTTEAGVRFTRPSKVNEEAFNLAIEDVTDAARRLITSLETVAPPKNREVEAAKAKARSVARFAS